MSDHLCCRRSCMSVHDATCNHCGSLFCMPHLRDHDCEGCSLSHSTPAETEALAAVLELRRVQRVPALGGAPLTDALRRFYAAADALAAERGKDQP